MIIDTHQHAFWRGRNDADLVADMDQHGIELAWLLTWEVPREEDVPKWHKVFNPLHFREDGTHKGILLGDLMTAKRNFPDRFVLGYCPAPSLPDAADMFRAAVEMHGVRVCGEFKFRILMDDPRCLELFRAAGEKKCPVVLHLDVPYRRGAEGKMEYDPNWYGGTIENLERALVACPETNFIGHAPGFWREISGDAEQDPSAYPLGPIVPGGKLYGLLDRNPNLYADLSAGSGLKAMKRDVKHAEQFLTRYADRLLFGRDNYGGDLPAFFPTLELSGEVREKICWRNARRMVE